MATRAHFKNNLQAILAPLGLQRLQNSSKYLGIPPRSLAVSATNGIQNANQAIFEMSSTSVTRTRRATQRPTSTPKKQASSASGVAKRAATRLRSKRLSTRAATTRVTRLPRKTVASASRSVATRRRLKPAASIATPSLWPQDQTGIVALSERVVIEIEAASFIITWAVLSAALTAIGILILLRAPILL